MKMNPTDDTDDVREPTRAEHRSQLLAIATRATLTEIRRGGVR